MARKALWVMAPVLIIGAIIWRERFSGYRLRSAEQHFALSEEYAHTGDTRGAQREMALALQDDPKYAEARDGLATIYATNGNVPAAVRLYNEGIELQPKTVSLRYDLGELYYMEHKYDDAIPPLEESIRLDPSFLPGYRLLGLCYEQSKRRKDAERFWQDAIRKHPEDPILAHSLARLRRQMKDRARSGGHPKENGSDQGIRDHKQ